MSEKNDFVNFTTAGGFGGRLPLNEQSYILYSIFRNGEFKSFAQVGQGK
jgi:hypothetical protein